MAVCQKGIPVKFCRTAALVNQLSEAKKDGILGALLKKLNKASVIILDELCKDPDELIMLGEKVKTVLLNGKSVLLVTPLSSDSGVKWQTCSKQQLRSF